MSHSAVEHHDGFLRLKKEVAAEISRAVQKDVLNLAETVAILQLLGIADNEFELQRLMYFLVGRFPFLEHFVQREKHQDKVAVEGKIQEIVSKIIRENPLFAAELAQEVVKKDVKLEDLLQKYPQIQKYL